jgi:hypothetical protein
VGERGSRDAGRCGPGLGRGEDRRARQLDRRQLHRPQDVRTGENKESINSVSDPDHHQVDGSGSVFGNRIRIQKGKNDP